MEQRTAWLDYARVFAIISISCNHAITRAFYDYDSAYEAYAALPFTGSVFRAVIFIFSRLGVPFFLMITGSLLLNKRISSKEDIARFYRHNLGRLFITCEIWIFIAFWFVALFLQPEILSQGVVRVLLQCLGSLLFLNQVDIGSMWYIPMILCLYLLIPFLNILINKFGTRLMLIPCALVFLGSMILPNINAFCSTAGISLNLNLVLSPDYLFSYYLLYVFAGYCVSRDCFRRFSLPALLSAAILTFVLSCAYQGWLYMTPGADRTYYDFVPMALSAVCLFACFHRLSEKLKARRSVAFVSKISFGIYFVHIYIMTALVWLLAHRGIHPIILFFIYEIASVGAAILVIAVLSRISFFKKYFFLIKDRPVVP